MLIHDDASALSLTPNGRACGDTDFALLFRDEELLLRLDGDRLKLPQYRDVRALAQTPPAQCFTLNGVNYFVGWFAGEPAPDGGLAVRSARIFRAFEPKHDGYVINLAYHLQAWYRANRFCGACGGALSPSAKERALVCDRCGLTVYPKIAPAIAVALTDGDRILLARNAQGTFRHFSLIAGYVEAGETLEQTVHRELMEEVGLRARNVRYVASQPWGLSQTLMVGFAAELDGARAITLQESELAEARWFARDELEPQDDPPSLSFELIERFRRGTL